MDKDMIEKKYCEWDKHVQVDVCFLLKSWFSNTSRNPSGKAAEKKKKHTRCPDEAQISEVQEKFPSNSKSLTAALASSQSVRFQWKRDHTLILSHQKCYRSPVMLDFFFFFFFISFFLPLFFHPNCVGGGEEGGGGGGGESWAVANTHAHQRHIIKVSHLSCMACSPLLPAWWCTHTVIRLHSGTNN